MKLLPKIAAVTVLAGSLSLLPITAEAGNFTATVINKAGLNVRAEPTMNSRVVRGLKNKARVGLQCYKTGSAVTGPYGKSKLWYKIDGGGWVTDALIYTGRNSAVTRKCPPNSSKKASKSDGRRIGKTTYRNNGIHGQCTELAYDRFHRYSGRWPLIGGNALSWHGSAKSNGWSTTLDAQPNSVVVFQPGVTGASGYGHVAWVEKTERRRDGLYIYVQEKNWRGWNVVSNRWIKDVRGMSYILAPRK